MKRTEKFKRIVDLIIAADHRPRHAAEELAERWAGGLTPHASFDYPYADRREIEEAVSALAVERMAVES